MISGEYDLIDGADDLEQKICPRSPPILIAEIAE